VQQRSLDSSLHLLAESFKLIPKELALDIDLKSLLPFQRVFIFLLTFGQDQVLIYSHEVGRVSCVEVAHGMVGLAQLLHYL